MTEPAKLTSGCMFVVDDSFFNEIYICINETNSKGVLLIYSQSNQEIFEVYEKNIILETIKVLVE